jgi:hypothetical protein
MLLETVQSYHGYDHNNKKKETEIQLRKQVNFIHYSFKR